MANQSVITITHNEGSVDITAQIQASNLNRSLEIQRLQNYLLALQNGVRLATVKVGVLALKASGTLTFNNAGAATDTLTINGVVFTAVASGATGNQWNVGASATASAAAAAAAINASASSLISGFIIASAASGVITITSSDPGQNGNCMTIAAGQVSITASGARLTGGSNGTVKSYQYGGSGL